MADMSKVRIKKQSYQFQVRKKYQDAVHYKVKQKTPLQQLQTQVASILAPKQKKSEIRSSSSSGFAEKKPASGFNFLFFGGMLLIGIILLSVVGLYLFTQSNPVANQFAPNPDKPYLQNNVLSGDILSAGDRGTNQRVAAILLDYRSTNLQNYTINITTYDDMLPQEVFVLNSEKFEASSYSDFISQVRSQLLAYQIPVNEISFKDLQTLPQGAIVIIPSGIIPEEMLGVGSTISPANLTSRGIVVVYIGQPFSHMLNGSLVVSTPTTLLNSLPFGFDSSSPSPSDSGFNLYQPLYRVIPRSGWDGQVIYGSVSVAKHGNGAFVFLPQTLDGGWRENATSAASDVARIVLETPWSSPNSNSNIYYFENSTNYSGTRYFFSKPFDSDSASVKVDVTGYSPSSNYPLKQRLYYNVEKSQKGDLFVDSGFTVAPTNLTGDRVRINAQLRESSPSAPDMSLIVLDSNASIAQQTPQGSVNVQAEKSFDLPLYVDRGEYILSLSDDYGKVYAKSYLNVVSIDTTIKGYGSGMYVFDFTKNGQPVTLSQISVSIDGGKYGTYSFPSGSSVSVDVRKYTGGDNLPVGDHNFEFTSGGYRTSVKVSTLRVKRIFDEPYFIVAMVLFIGLLIIGFVFARPENVYFSLDVPDFPPVARTKVPLSTDTILSVFEKANDAYRWQSTPLTPYEVKSGFKQIYFKGNPIFITDYNIDYLLADLQRRGLVRESIGYFGLKSWESRTGRSIEYLSLMRKLRDICVNNAVPFTPLGESTSCDSEITVVGQSMFVHFYDPTSDTSTLIKKVLSTLSKGITIVMFRNDLEKSSFVSSLNSPSTSALILKLESDSKSVLFQTSEELEKMLIEFKSV